MTEPKKANRLIHEKSPYLLQHAYNPMDWYPWGAEAFSAAEREDKPIFLSIGYATCHWCHVMEKESFENEELARLMNDTFINIKIDREELPQVDSLYMEFAQALMTSSGGWPLNVLLTPDRKPFFAVTYLPPKSYEGMTGLDQFTKQIKQLWNSEERGALVEQASRLVEIFANATLGKNEKLPTEEHVKGGAEMLFTMGDSVYGGIKGEPKFPFSYHSLFMLAYAQKKQEPRALFFVERTLEMMRRGGIYDHLGGGFSRYAIDEQWHVPHFEKMLYDNVLLSRAYLEAWKATGNGVFRTVCVEVLEYLLRTLHSDNGGFYCAEDADLRGKEGVYYTWTPEEVEECFSGSDSELFCLFYGITDEGNFEGRSVLHIDFPLLEFAENFSVPPEELDTKLSEMKKVLLEKRALRGKPFVDDKILASWNGLAIDAFAATGLALGEEKYLEIAEQTGEFLLQHLVKEGVLHHRFRDGEAKFRGNLDDYAFVIKGFLTLFSAGRGTKWLSRALDLSKRVEEKFLIDKGGFFPIEEEETFLIRRSEYYDGAEPSGSGVHAENLMRLFQLTFNPHYLSLAEGIFKGAKGVMEAYPPGVCYHLLSLMRYLDSKATTLIVATSSDPQAKRDAQQLISSYYFPHLEVIYYEAGDEELLKLLPHLKDKVPVGGNLTLYPCDRKSCHGAATGREEIAKLLKNL